MVKLRCPKCKNEWDYKGSNPYKANCSYCGNPVYINSKNVIGDWPKSKIGFLKKA